MQENAGPEPKPAPRKRRTSWRTRIILALLVIIVGAGAYGYFWYQQTLSLRQEAQEVVEEARKFSDLNRNIESEYERCQDFIAKRTGEFGSFEYCRRFIQWVDDNELRERN